MCSPPKRLDEKNNKFRIPVWEWGGRTGKET